MIETREKNQRIIDIVDEKTSQPMTRTEEENQRIIDIIDEKNFQFELRIGKEKPTVCGKKRDLVKIKCYLILSEVKPPL